MTKIVAAYLALAATLAGAGWGTHEYLSGNYQPRGDYARKGDVQLAGAKADFVIDRQMASIITEIAYLQRKKNKTQDELEQLRWLRKQLEEMRRVRSGR